MIAKPDKFLAEDSDLNDLMLRYVFKRMLEDDSEKVMKMFSEVWKKDFEKGSSRTQKSVAAKIQRVQALKVYETDKHIFLLPTDLWDDGKIKLPESSAAKYIAPQDLTAISKESGEEVRFFTFDDLLEVNEKLLKPNGYEIPASWVDIFPEAMSFRELMMKYRLEFTKEGDIIDGRQNNYGIYWASSAHESDERAAYYMLIHGYIFVAGRGVNLNMQDLRSCTASARCVSYRR